MGSIDLNSELLYRGAFTMASVKLEAGQSMKAESGAMVAMSDTIDLEGKLEGGFFKGLSRMIAGEKFFFQTLVASRGPGEVLLAPSMPGDISVINMDGSVPYIVHKAGFLAASSNLDVSTTSQNLVKGLFSGQGFFILKIGGKGTLFVSSFGSIHEIDIPSGEQLIVDNSHLVAWPENMDYNIEKAASGWISTITSGAGFVCRFKGPGKVLIQTRNPAKFAEWIYPLMPKNIEGGQG